MARLTLEQVHEMSLGMRDRKNDCDACGEGGNAEMPGILAPLLPDGDPAHAFIAKCDTCERWPNDDVACGQFALRFGLNVHRRWDDDQFLYWRPFVTEPRAEDDHDTVCVWEDGITGDFGVFPDSERPLTPEEQARATARVKEIQEKEG